MTFCIHRESLSRLSASPEAKHLSVRESVAPVYPILLYLLERHLSSVLRLRTILAIRLAQMRQEPESTIASVTTPCSAIQAVYHRDKVDDPPSLLPADFIPTNNLNAGAYYATRHHSYNRPFPEFPERHAARALSVSMHSPPSNRIHPAPYVPAFTALARDVLGKGEDVPSTPPTATAAATSVLFIVGRQRNA
jgi:hypothetical protein